MGMASIIVRGLDAAVKDQLVAQAKRHGRSMEAEVRYILTQAAQLPNIGIALMRAAQSVGGVDDLLIPARTDVARAASFE
jgi:plasmid stability protein